ncbi:hypothetical protein Lepto7376_4497 [[Leptolyngbya] sp. PCC 7376]|uniref:hypothetical protein n=1 Tax=[Leptolyngbya] sp. PCC 7376 TaxID=111781 RepID=UPI00029EE63C|nr:hypothetical protein [[Leptolyngbya] sp. PCC 7376]AFY40599.1 hypothetical protein Lepto7376_4497 [[Leptolyngbya] sp. PCC 7376]
MSIITLLHFTSAISAVCSIYAAMMTFSVSDSNLESMTMKSEKSIDILQYRGVSYVRFPQEKIEISVES